MYDICQAENRNTAVSHVLFHNVRYSNSAIATRFQNVHSVSTVSLCWTRAILTAFLAHTCSCVQASSPAPRMCRALNVRYISLASVHTSASLVFRWDGQAQDDGSHNYVPGIKRQPVHYARIKAHQPCVELGRPASDRSNRPIG